jgi:hypothetical protein
LFASLAKHNAYFFHPLTVDTTEAVLVADVELVRVASLACHPEIFTAGVFGNLALGEGGTSGGARKGRKRS